MPKPNGPAQGSPLTGYKLVAADGRCFFDRSDAYRLEPGKTVDGGRRPSGDVMELHPSLGQAVSEGLLACESYGVPGLDGLEDVCKKGVRLFKVEAEGALPLDNGGASAGRLKVLEEVPLEQHLSEICAYANAQTLEVLGGLLPPVVLASLRLPQSVALQAGWNQNPRNPRALKVGSLVTLTGPAAQMTSEKTRQFFQADTVTVVRDEPPRRASDPATQSRLPATPHIVTVRNSAGEDMFLNIGYLAVEGQPVPGTR